MIKYIFISTIMSSILLAAVSVQDGISALDKKNYEKAYSIFMKSCKLKNPGACYNLAVMYDFGMGIKKEKEKAIELYEMSCKNGIVNACFNLGVIYDKGESSSKISIKQLNIIQLHVKKETIDHVTILLLYI